MTGDVAVDAVQIQIVLAETVPTLSAVKVVEYSQMLARVLWKYGINTKLRIAAFIAQLAHESGGFRYVEEIWGPTPQQRRYGVGKLAAKLGNKSVQDGYVYRGRGWIQLTGRANYAKYGTLAGLDLVTNPALAARPDVAFELAALYWQDNGFNDLADKGMFKAITKGINGGFNGLVSRMRYYRAANKSLESVNV